MRFRLLFCTAPLLMCLLVGCGDYLLGGSDSAGASVDETGPDTGQHTPDVADTDNHQDTSASPDLPEDMPESDTAIADSGDVVEHDTETTDTDSADLPDATPDMPIVDESGPFAPQPDTSQGLTNTSENLEALLEYGELTSACERYRADPSNTRLKLLCGKWMFVYEAFGTSGIPVPIFDFIGNRLTAVAPAHSGFGMIPDPYATDPARPLGVAEGSPLGTVQTMAFTCASCHLGQLPDGRYAMGAPNYRYEYGLQNLSVLMVPLSIVPGWDEAAHDPLALERLRPLLDEIQNNQLLSGELFFNLLPLVGQTDNVPTITPEIEGHYARWKAGTMDFLIAPLPADDAIMTVSKILPLWGIPSPEAQEIHGLSSAQLGSTGGVPNVEHFVIDFVRIGGGAVEQWPKERVEPLVAYIESLRAPTPPALDAALVTQGAQIFESVGCLGCHSAPGGGGWELYDFESIGTDSVLKHWGDAELSGEYCCDLDGPVGLSPTHSLKSPRLLGLWAMDRFLHNGSVETLEALLCMPGERDAVTEPGYGNQGHTFGCDLWDEDKRALIAFLKSH